MLLIYFSPVRWNSFTQRPHEFVNYFIEKTKGNGKVIWIEPYATRLANFNDIFRFSNQEKEMLRDKPGWLEIVKPGMFPVEPLPVLNILNKFQIYKIVSGLKKKISSLNKTFVVVGKPSALAYEVLQDSCIKESIYDAMDDFPSFYRGISFSYMKRIELAISNNVQNVIVSSTNLEKKFISNRVQVTRLLNACSKNKIQALKIQSYRDLKKNKIIGYVGTIAQWFDWGFVIELAKVASDYEIRLIGSLLSPPPANLPPNISLKPAVPHQNAIYEMMHFDLALIPFKINKLTHHVDPIKYYEYTALGLPILSTNFGEMAYRNNISHVILTDKENLKFLTFPIKTVIDYVDCISWQERFEDFFAEKFNVEKMYV